MAKLFIASSLRRQAERTPGLLRLLWALEGGLLWGLQAACRLLPPDRASALGRRLLAALGPRMRKTRMIRRNLALAFPGSEPAIIDGWVREVWGNLGAVIAEFPHLGRICAPGSDRLQFEYRGEHRVFRDQGRPAVFAAAHLANWEIAAASIVRQGVPLAVVYTPLSNPYLDRMLRRARSALGCRLVEREGAVRQLMGEMKQGVSVGLIVDQRVEGGAPVPFFGRDMDTSLTPAQLACRFGCELVPIQVQRLEGARFRVIFHEPLLPDASLDRQQQALEMTRRLNALFEDWIRQRPGEWLCTKRRWAKDRAARDKDRNREAA